MSQIITAENNPFFEKKKEKKSAMNRAVNILQGLVIVAFVGILVYLFIATPNQVSGRSMLPNFLDNEYLLTNRMVQWFHGTGLGDSLGLSYQRGDVVVISTPELPSEEYIIKRIIGLPGDTVSIEDGDVYLNGQLLDESSYLSPILTTDSGTFLEEGDILTVPEGKFCILGDNRPESLDSRNLPLGFISRSQVVGKVFLRFYPFEHFGFIGNAQDTSHEDSQATLMERYQ